MPPLASACAGSILRCRSLNTAIPLNRLYSSAPGNNKVRPEHPYFIDVPGQAPTRRILRQHDVKGTLPPPRDVLKTRALATPKHLPEFFEATIPEPKDSKNPKNKLAAWKRQMADMRRKNLRESLTVLHTRKMERQKHLASVRQGQQKRRQRLLNAPIREDERLTNPTVTSLNSVLQSGPLPDPNRAARLAAKAARVQEKAEIAMQRRKDALHTLYMNARNFITTEEDLEDKIQEIFTLKPFLENDYNDNIWDALGSPPTAQDMLKNSSGSSKTATQAYQSPAVVIGERMRIIAEELTGGKMETPKDALVK
ncbi:unnamed protein product [Blumeria hordei]|uniref:Uncharacterized protein n=1 Tax=Blumeria hordei TaxID=2867405 RepID=A0A383UG96_BLUHO|nr:unnamed protein product [Blumeria hordei]